MRIIAFLFLILLAGYSCSVSKYSTANKSYKSQVRAFAKTISQAPLKDSFATGPEWVGTTNFGMRKPNFVIIHHTAQNSCEQTLQTFTLPRTQVSAHYVICRDGTIHHLLNDYLRAWHAGLGKWGNVTDVNSSSIGIELDNNGLEIFPDAQINSLLSLLGFLKKSFSIPAANFIGHADIAPTRKDDPNVHFPWQQLSAKGFGLWYDDTSKINVPVNFNNTQALRIIGYDIKDSAAAIEAFKRHFEQQDSSRVLTEQDRKILYNISKKYL
ncbi:MAG: N-acetylmuramoyl-L-alanine amidase [Chitinophagaceae bacterium]|nr:N-acetylmuramoyl-L-alanine amidase [Chitinophagaceae bacterium]